MGTGLGGDSRPEGERRHFLTGEPVQGRGSSPLGLLTAITGLVPVIAVTACAAASDPVDQTSSGQARPDPRIEALVPRSIRGGTVRVGTFPVVAPMEFRAADGRTLVGADIDLVQEIARRLGARIQLIETGFDGLIPGIESGRFDMAVDSITDNRERQRAVDFVDYLREGSAYYFPADSSAVNSASDLCGRTVGVVKGTIYAEQAEAQSARCPKSNPLKTLDFADQPSVNLAMASGRVDVALADEPVAIWAVNRSKARFALSKARYGRAPFGMAFPKRSRLLPAVVAALELSIKDGTYMRILRKWGLQDGAVEKVTVNGEER